MADTRHSPSVEEEKRRASRVARRSEHTPRPVGRRVQKSRGAGKKVAISLCVALLVILLAGGALSAYALLSYDKVFPGVRVDDLDLSGLSRSDALSLVTSYYSNRSPASSFRLTIGEYTYDVSLTAEDLGYDSRLTAEEAWLYGRQGSMFQRLGAILSGMGGKVQLVPALTLDESRLEQKVIDIARQAGQELSEAAYTFEDYKLVVDQGQVGTSIDELQLYSFLADKMLRLDFSDATFVLSEDAPDVLNLLLIKGEIEQEMRNPSLDLEADPTGGVIIPSQVGVSMDLDRAEALLESTNERFVEIPLTITYPQYTTEEFESYLFRDVLATGRTTFDPGLTGRTTNVRLATDACNDIILNPGEIFSYNNTVGPRTYERGFMDATIYVGDETEDGVGGGICQVSSTLYYACLRADLEIVERTCHSRRVTYVPLGEDATVAWGYLDYKFRNDTDFPIKIVATHGSNWLSIELVGTQLIANKEVRIETTTLSNTPYETVYIVDESLPVGTEQKRDNGYTGYKTESYRVVYIDGKEVSRTLENKSTYKKYDQVNLHNPAPEVPAQPTVTETHPEDPVVTAPDPNSDPNPDSDSETPVIPDPAPNPEPDPTAPVDPTPGNTEIPDPISTEP